MFKLKVTSFWPDVEVKDVYEVPGFFQTNEEARSLCKTLCKQECDMLNEGCSTNCLQDGFRWDEPSKEEGLPYDYVSRLWSGDDARVTMGIKIEQVRPGEYPKKKEVHHLFMTVNKKDIEVRPQDIDDIMVSALEGGINFWCNQAEVVEDDYFGEYASEQISRGGSLRLHLIEPAEKSGKMKYILNRENFIKGLTLFANDEDPYGAFENGRVDTTKIDGPCASDIVQLALWGEVVFG